MHGVDVEKVMLRRKGCGGVGEGTICFSSGVVSCDVGNVPFSGEWRMSCIR